MQHDANTADNARRLATVDIFTDLSQAQLDAVAAAAPARSFTAGELIITPRQRVESLVILTRGRVRTFTLSTDGRMLTTGLLAPGEVFGEMIPLPDQEVRAHFAEAIEDVTVCAMNRADVQRLLLSDARLAGRLCTILARRVHELERRLSDAIFKNGPERIAATLTLLADNHANTSTGRTVQIPVTHEEVAALAGTSRETATRVLGEYADRGLLRLGRRTLTILDPQAIAAEAGQ